MSEDFGPVQWFDWDHVQFQRGRNLPHFEQAGAIYFITFRLWDSLPAEVYQELFAARDQWLGNNPPPYTRAQELELKRVYSLPLERFLDEGHGRCVLRDEGLRDELVDIMLCFDGEAYEVGEFVVMPNHVHLLMRTSRKDHAESLPAMEEPVGQDDQPNAWPARPSVAVRRL